MKTSAQLLVCCALLTGCATDYRPAHLASDHPANIHAEEAPRAGARHLAANDTLTAKTKARLAADIKTKAASSAPKTSGVYACPMHPEVHSDKPGHCPKCGMTLVKKQ